MSNFKTNEARKKRSDKKLQEDRMGLIEGWKRAIGRRIYSVDIDIDKHWPKTATVSFVTREQTTTADYESSKKDNDAHRLSDVYQASEEV